jgi:hypothetical protein
MIPSNQERRIVAPGVVEFKLEGGGGLEDVPAEDVGIFIIELVRVVARAAGYALNRPVKDTGRFESLVKSASQVRIQSIESSSVLVTIAPSKSEAFFLGDNLGLDAKDVSEQALVIASDTVKSAGARYPDVARVWVDLADRVGIGKRYERVVIVEAGDLPVILDAKVTERLRDVSERTLHGMGTDVVDGVLFAADFEKLTAKLRLGDKSLVDVAFDLEHADDIKQALRNRTTIAGHAEYSRKTHRILSVRLQRLDKPQQLTLGGEFWVETSARQLLEEQGVTRPLDPAWFRIDGITPSEWDEYFEALAE